jgi:hypothetical protein
LISRLRSKKNETIRLSAPNDLVYALSDVGRAGKWIQRGTPVHRDHEYVQALPHEFEVRYRLSEEVKDGSEYGLSE